MRARPTSCDCQRCGRPVGWLGRCIDAVVGCSWRGCEVAARPSPEPGLAVLFGYAAIARFLGLSRNQVRALAQRGALPTFDLDGVPCARRATLRDHITRLEGEPAQPKGVQP